VDAAAAAPDIHLYTGDASQLLRSTLGRTTWSRYLDLGCGDGALLYALDARGYFRGKRVLAVDVSEQRLRRVRRLNPRFVCAVNDACSLGIIGSSTIDFVTSSHVIEHTEDDNNFIREIARIMKSGRILYLATPYKKWYGWFYKRNDTDWVLDPTHVREYTDEHQLIGLLEREGFTVLENKKSILRFSILDFVLRRSGATHGGVYENSVLKQLRRIKIPWPGYYHWELVLRRR
jgi:SAM-dependent methyltransferase